MELVEKDTNKTRINMNREEEIIIIKSRRKYQIKKARRELQEAGRKDIKASYSEVPKGVIGQKRSLDDALLSRGRK